MPRTYLIGTARASLCTAATVLLPPPDMTVSEWADAFRVLSREDSAAPGRWSSDSRPYQRGIMDAASAPRIQYVTVVGGAQWGKTQILNNILGQRIHLNPGPMMVVAPTERAAEKWSKTRFAPMVRDCPELRVLLGDRARDSSNTILEKTFPGGLLVAVGANAPAGLASQPIRDLLIDEVDRIPMDETVEGEGDYEDLAEARTSDFEGRRLIYKCSTPTILGRSRIENSWKESNQQFWNVTCPHCGFEQVLTFKNVVFGEDGAEPVYACHGGGCQITEPELRRAVRVGRWIATRPDVLDHAGFWVHGLMIRPMATLVSKFRKAKKKGLGPLQTFINTQLGEWWDPRDGDSLQVEGLQKRARESDYTSGQVPDGAGLLVASCDVQDDRLEVLVLGVGGGEETWRIAREIIPGNLTMAEPWLRLEETLLHRWPRLSSGSMRIRVAAIDIGGHFTKQVYAFCRRPKMKGLAHPVKGAVRPQLKLALRSKNSRLWLVDTVQAKDQILHRLKIERPGFGYCHFPNDMDRDYFEQLLAEHRKPGKRLYEKVTTDARNEALDLEVYATAALFIYAPKDLAAMAEKASILRGAPMEVNQPSSEDPRGSVPVPPEAPSPVSVRVIQRMAQGGAPPSIALLIPRGGSGAW